MTAHQALAFERVLANVATRAASKQTREQLLQLEPLLEIADVHQEGSYLAEMMDIHENQGGLSLDELHPATGELKTLATAGGFLSGEQLRHLRIVLEMSSRLCGFIKQQRDSFPRIAVLLEELADFTDQLHAIDKIADPEGEILDTASRKLGEIRRTIKKEKRQLEKKMISLAEQLTRQQVAQENLVTYRNGHLTIPVRENMQSRVQGIIIDQSDSGATVFVEPKVAVEAGNQLQRLMGQEQQEIVRLLREFTEQLREHLPMIEVAVEHLHRLDFLSAKARYGRHLKGCAPVVTEKMELVLKQARHPLLLEKQEVVPLDLEVGGRSRMLLISGPNAGGKTVALKTIGLIALMARCGLPIPASAESRIPFFAAVYNDIGDEQSIDNDLSTFSSHMQRIMRMVRHSRDNALFLIDEMGSGTDPDAGTALAKAIMERLLQSPGLTIITTHLGGLKAYAHEEPHISNGSMSFAEERIEPTFKFIPDVPGSSYALEIAERMGAPKFIVVRSRYFMGTEQKSLEKLITSLRRRMQIYQTKNTRVKAREIELESQIEEYRMKLKGVRRETRDIKRQALEESKRILEESNREVENTIREIRAKDADTKIVKAAREQLVSKRQLTEQKLSKMRSRERTVTQTGFKKGDWVRISDITEPVQIISLDGAAGTLVGKSGPFKMTFALNDVTGETAPPDQKKRSRGAGGNYSTRSLPTVDLRGMTVEEALEQIEAYLDSCVLNDLREVTLLHGKGTGVLRENIHKYLKHMRQVKQYRRGTLPEGGDGITVVTLRIDD